MFQTGLKTLHLYHLEMMMVNLKYVDFSHLNAYDTVTRPIQTVIKCC